MPMHEVFCAREGCDNTLDETKLRKHGNLRRQRYCSHHCAALAQVEIRRAAGFYERFSRAGNTAQRALAEQIGPAVHEKRVAALLAHRQRGRTKRTL